jgi:hypothetical protein
MYFSQLRVDALNPEVLYVAGLPVAKSLDGGKTFATLDEEGGHGEPGHVDQHAIWVDPKNSNHLMIGNDGGTGGASYHTLLMLVPSFHEIRRQPAQMHEPPG